MDEFDSGNALKEIIDNRIHQLNPLIKHGVSIEELKNAYQKKKKKNYFLILRKK